MSFEPDQREADLGSAEAGSESDRKRPYSVPELTRFGTVLELTHGSNAPIAENMLGDGLSS